MTNEAQTSAPSIAGLDEFWEHTFSSRTWGRYPAEALVRFMSRNFNTVPDKSSIKVLEVGTGPGANIWYLSREGFSVSGIDGSETAIRQTRERLEAEGLPSNEAAIDLRVGDFQRLPWGNASFDVVVDLESIYANTMTTIAATIAEIKRVLKPGGLFFGQMFSVHTSGSEAGELVEVGTIRDPKTGPFAGHRFAHFFTREELGQLFSDFGEFRLDQLHRTDHCGEIDFYEWLVSARK